VSAASTRARLKASAEAGTLRTSDAANLCDAFELLSALRMEHQVGQLREGEAADNLIEPRSLTAPARASLKEVFRAIGGVQRRIAAEYGLQLR
jgi:CBS domain-containing protein